MVMLPELLGLWQRQQVGVEGQTARGQGGRARAGAGPGARGRGAKAGTGGQKVLQDLLLRRGDTVMQVREPSPMVYTTPRVPVNTL